MALRKAASLGSMTADGGGVSMTWRCSGLGEEQAVTASKAANIIVFLQKFIRFFKRVEPVFVLR